MLGPAKPCHLDEPIAFSLQALVPKGHFYRHLETQLDLSFVREWAQELYAERGRPSIDPVVLFKLQPIVFCEGIRSERKLIETASLNLAHRWYLGYALAEELPDHSSLTRIRQRLGIAVFQRFFERIVDLCQEAGLVWGRELCFDATKVEANAGIPSLIPRFYYDATTPSPISVRMRPTLHRKPTPPSLRASCRCRSTPRVCLPRAIRRGGSARSVGSTRTVPPAEATGARVTFG